MFGYVRVRQEALSAEDKTRYEAAYCGLCRTMGAEYGPFTRFFLNYDFALLAMLLAPAGHECVTGCKPCLAHPIEGRACCSGGSWMETAAGESVILTYWKLRDSVADSGALAGLSARFLGLCLARGYRKAKADYPAFDAQVALLLNELSGLEREKSPSIDRTADCFARLLRSAAPVTGDSGRDRAMGALLYHLGRWIYLIDGVDDLAEDRAAGRYNPVLARFPQWSEADKDYLRNMLDHSLSLAGAAFQLLEPNPWTPVVENILYSGLPGVEELVFSGKWRAYLKKQRRESHGRSV